MPRKIGIVGGVSWRSTIDYYAAFHELAARRAGPADRQRLEISIESLDLEVALALLEYGVRKGSWAGFDDYHRAALERLELSGAQVAVMASSTPHVRFSEIVRDTDLEVVDLFDAVCAKARRHRARQLLVLGTSATMGSERLRTMLEAHGIRPLYPVGQPAQELERLIRDLQCGTVPNAKERLLAIVEACTPRSAEPWLVGLHCTELPLALPASETVTCLDGIGFLNVSKAHVEAALRAAGF